MRDFLVRLGAAVLRGARRVMAFARRVMALACFALAWVFGALEGFTWRAAERLAGDE